MQPYVWVTRGSRDAGSFCVFVKTCGVLSRRMSHESPRFGRHRVGPGILHFQHCRVGESLEKVVEAVYSWRTSLFVLLSNESGLIYRSSATPSLRPPCSCTMGVSPSCPPSLECSLSRHFFTNSFSFLGSSAIVSSVSS